MKKLSVLFIVFATYSNLSIAMNSFAQLGISSQASHKEAWAAYRNKVMNAQEVYRVHILKAQEVDDSSAMSAQEVYRANVMKAQNAYKEVSICIHRRRADASVNILAAGFAKAIEKQTQKKKESEPVQSRNDDVFDNEKMAKEPMKEIQKK